MINAKDIAAMATNLSGALVADAIELVATGKTVEDLTPEETEATVAVILAALGALQSYIMSVLPPDKAASVRAYLDRLSHDIQHARNTTPLSGASPHAELPQSS